MTSIHDIEKLITQKKLSALFFIICLAYLLFPFPIPMKVSTWTMDFVNEIDKLSPGDVVIWGYEWTNVPPPRAGNTINAVLLRYLMERDLKLVLASFQPATPGNFYLFMTEYAHAEEYGYEYGKDWIVLPFLAGEETVLALLAENMWYSETDMFGTPLDQLPIMEEIHVIEDCDLAIIMSGAFTFIPMFVRQWSIRHEIRTIGMYAYSTVAIYYGIYVHGVLDRTRGWAEFEYLVGFYQGEEYLRFATRNILATIVFLTVIIGNLAYYAKRREGREAMEVIE